ncbi:MAG: portal protein, partial [Campylobacterota bacterium]
CPAMTSLGDIKGLQIEEKRKAQAIAKMVNPPLHGPASLRDKPISSIPGGASTYDTGQGQEKLSPIYQTDPRVQELMLDIEKVEGRIDKAFFVDLFMAISNMEGIQPKKIF